MVKCQYATKFEYCNDGTWSLFMHSIGTEEEQLFKRKLLYDSSNART